MKNFRSQLRKPTIIGCSLLCGFTSASSFFIFVTQDQKAIGNLVFGVLLLVLAFFIFKEYRGALRLMAGIFILIAVVLPIGILNPFTAGDYMAAGREPPSVLSTLLWLIPIEVLLLVIVFIIDPVKKQISTKKKNSE